MTYKKFLAIVVLFTMCQIVVARSNSLVDYERGFLIGAQAGYGIVDPGDVVNDLDSTKGRFGSRLYIGYSFCPWFAIDLGYAFYKGDKYTFKGARAGTDHNLRINVYAIDLLAKAILPLENISTSLTGWSLYGKLGPVLAFTGINSDDEMMEARSDVKLGYALGIGYNFTDHFGIDLSWSGIYGDKINKNSTEKERKDFKVPSANLIALGVSYKF